MRGGSIADFNSVFHAESPWKKVREVSLRWTSPGIYRLRISVYPKLFGPQAVDAEIKCTKDQALALEELLKRRLSEAAKNSDRQPDESSRKRI
jgi:hypothetical protein